MVKVLTGYDEFRAQRVEEVTRIPVQHESIDRHGRWRTPFVTVSYGGKQRRVFHLPESYGEIAGACITVDD